MSITDKCFLTKIMVFVFSWLIVTNITMAVTPEQLMARIEQNENITVIDIRSSSQYRAGHIPGAVNIPAAMIAAKTLPRFGTVVVCGSGLGREDIDQAVASLMTKPGLEVEVLAGGYAAWQESGGLSTGKSRLRKQYIEYVTYADLKQHNSGNMVFVDLRKKAKDAATVQPAGTYAVSAVAPVVIDNDIFTDFPGVSVITDPFAGNDGNRAAQGINTVQEKPVYVLIDNGDGKAQATARALKANKNRRVVVLLGGEEMMKRKGRTGLQRSGAGTGLRNEFDGEQK